MKLRKEKCFRNILVFCLFHILLLPPIFVSTEEGGAFPYDETEEHDGKDFIFRHESFEIPLRIHIALLGFHTPKNTEGGRGGNLNLKLDPRELERLLVSNLLYHRPSSIEEEKMLTNINFHLRYSSRHLPFEDLQVYEALLSEKLKRKDEFDNQNLWNGLVEEERENLWKTAHYGVEVKGEIEQFFDDLHRKMSLSVTAKYSKGEAERQKGGVSGSIPDNEYTVFIVNPRRDKFLPHPQEKRQVFKNPEDEWQDFKGVSGKRRMNWWKGKQADGLPTPPLYHDDLEDDLGFPSSDNKTRLSHPQWGYTYDDGPITQSWVGNHRYVVLDLATSPISFGPMTAGEGVVIPGSSVPDVQRFINIARSAASSAAKLLSQEAQQAVLKEGENEEAERGGVEVKLLSEYLSGMAEFKASVVTSVISAIKHVFAPDLLFSSLPFADKVLIPVIVFQNHASFDPLQNLQKNRIKEVVEGMALPGQQLVVVHGQHSLHDHKHISLALSKSTRTESTYEATTDPNGHTAFVPRRKSFIDSKSLMLAIREAADLLAAGLLKHSDQPELYRAFFNEDIPFIGLNQTRSKALQGTRIVPVYVFSMEVPEGETLFLDRSSSLMAASSDMVIVLQTSQKQTLIPYFSEHHQISINSNDPTRHIIGGLASALGGVVDPATIYSPTKGKVILDYGWTHGCSPFGPFTSSSCLSQVFLDAIIRNSVVSRAEIAINTIISALDAVEMFGEKWMFEHSEEDESKSTYSLLGITQPSENGDLGTHFSKKSWLEELYHLPSQKSPITKTTIRRLHGEIRHLEKKFIDAADLLSRYHLEEAYKISSSFGVVSQRFKQYVEDEIAAAEGRMHCCEVQHQVLTTWTFSSMMSTMISYSLLLLVVFLLWLFIFSVPSTSTSSSQRRNR